MLRRRTYGRVFRADMTLDFDVAVGCYVKVEGHDSGAMEFVIVGVDVFRQDKYRCATAVPADTILCGLVI